MFSEFSVWDLNRDESAECASGSDPFLSLLTHLEETESEVQDVSPLAQSPELVIHQGLPNTVPHLQCALLLRD
jgi:hypothetical protein